MTRSDERQRPELAAQVRGDPEAALDRRSGRLEDEQRRPEHARAVGDRLVELPRPQPPGDPEDDRHRRDPDALARARLDEQVDGDADGDDRAEGVREAGEGEQDDRGDVAPQVAALDRQEGREPECDREREGDPERRQRHVLCRAEEEQDDRRREGDERAHPALDEDEDEHRTCLQAGDPDDPERQVVGPEDARQALVDHPVGRDQVAAVRRQQMPGIEIVAERQPVELVAPEGQVPAEQQDRQRREGHRDDEPGAREALAPLGVSPWHRRNAR